MTPEEPKEFPHCPAAFINSLREERAKDEIADWLQKTWNELCWVRKNRAQAIREAVQEESKVRTAAQALIDDVKRRHPGEELRCEYMRALDEALG